jgi:hypothetical protein
MCLFMWRSRIFAASALVSMNAVARSPSGHVRGHRPVMLNVGVRCSISVRSLSIRAVDRVTCTYGDNSAHPFGADDSRRTETN